MNLLLLDFIDVEYICTEKIIPSRDKHYQDIRNNSRDDIWIEVYLMYALTLPQVNILPRPLHPRKS